MVAAHGIGWMAMRAWTAHCIYFTVKGIGRKGVATYAGNMHLLAPNHWRRHPGDGP